MVTALSIGAVAYFTNRATQIALTKGVGDSIHSLAMLKAQATGDLLTRQDDGARGLRALRMAGGYTLAQDLASCVVYGMPQAAMQLGAVERAAAPADLARAICDLVGVGGSDGTAM